MSTFDRNTAYKAAKAAKVGEMVTCPCGCKKRFVKRSYQQAFFRNKGRGNCKDTYWNRATPTRLERAANVVNGRHRDAQRDDWEAYLDEVHPFSDEAVQP